MIKYYYEDEINMPWVQILKDTCQECKGYNLRAVPVDQNYRIVYCPNLCVIEVKKIEKYY